jgi:hypothetical protein
MGESYMRNVYTKYLTHPHFGRRWEYEPGLFHHSRLAMLSPTGAATKVRPAIPARAQILNLADTGGSNGYRPHA